MKNVFPDIEEYSLTIKEMGRKAFKTLSQLSFISDNAFVFASGDNVIFFKATEKGETYAIGVFLTIDRTSIIRYESICNYLAPVHADWKIDIEFLNDEIEITGKWYPVLKMEWPKGLSIDRFISKNLNYPGINDVFSEFQNQLVALCNSLEAHSIIHGDIRCSNILVQSFESEVRIKLIGYEGLLIPNLSLLHSDEKIISDFQHPETNSINASHFSDRFSIWVMLTVLEALKVDKTLWESIEKKGVNTFSNMFFQTVDYTNFREAELVKRLYGLNRLSLDYYLDNLSESCERKLKEIKKPDLFVDKDESRSDNKVLESFIISNDTDSKYEISSSDEFSSEEKEPIITLCGEVLNDKNSEIQIKRTTLPKGKLRIFLLFLLLFIGFFSLLYFKFSLNEKSDGEVTGNEGTTVVVPEPSSILEDTLIPDSILLTDVTSKLPKGPTVIEKMSVEKVKIPTNIRGKEESQNLKKDVESKPIPKPLKSGLEEYESLNYVTAHKLFTQEANQGDTEAQFYLGRMYERGEGVEKDRAQALFWYEKAAKGGDSRAKNRIDALLKLQSLD